MLELLDYEHVTSGFLPRFIVITAKTILGNLRPLGAPEPEMLAGRDALQDKLQELRNYYVGEVEVTAGPLKVPVQRKTEASLTPQAWRLYNDLEYRMLETGVKDTQNDLLTPTMARLSMSGLKVAVLIAASRLGRTVEVTEGDIIKAFSYVYQWQEHALEVIASIGTSKQEHTLALIYEYIRKRPGIDRSAIMRTYHLDARGANLIFDTLEQRGLINRTKAGRTERLTAM